MLFTKPSNNERRENGERQMAISEVERVALYWPNRAILTVRRDRHHLSLRSPNVPAGAELLVGGCILFRLPVRRALAGCDRKERDGCEIE